MCTLALYFQQFADYPIIAAANRDELLARPSDPPVALNINPWIWGGRDQVAGGTWLGVNEYGVMAGILNRQSPHPPDPSRRSRGQLCLDALRFPCAQDAARQLATSAPDEYNPFSLVIADTKHAFVINTATPRLQLHQLKPGLYLFTNRDFNDPTCPRIARLTPQFRHLSEPLTAPRPSLSTIFSQLYKLMADHDPSTASTASTASPDLDPLGHTEHASDPRTSLCLHADGYGTCSSTVLAYHTPLQRYHYQFAPGAPCQHAYKDVPLPPGPRASQPPSTT